MKTLIVPQFDRDTLQFTGNIEVKIKNKPNTADYNKVAKKLPGLTLGYCEQLYTIGQTEKPIEITSFYDVRQGKDVNKLKGFFIKLKK